MPTVLKRNVYQRTVDQHRRTAGASIGFLKNPLATRCDRPANRGSTPVNRW
ncbi:hypothetical protein HAX54_017905 [Datura stramonium]|uniref:Uncharacterized protein n=1 Tax=Datura stramonium TaxID=4076 RepID=A0ABS8RJB1_DATST|nr:hypothetical protein [Datura stramonium]